MTPLERAKQAVSNEVVEPIDDWKAGEIVRAVLLAIREPSEGMKTAGAYQLNEGAHLDASLKDVAFAWQIMIDAALEEG